MKKKLEVNTDVYFHSYTHHGYFHAIASKYDNVSDNIVAQVEVENFEESKWKIENEQLEYSINSGVICFKPNRLHSNMNCSFYREISEDDRLVLTIRKQLPLSRNGNINMFLTHENREELSKLEKCLKVECNYDDGLGLGTDSEYIFTGLKTNEFPVKVEMVYKNSEIIIFHNEVEVKRYKADKLKYIGFEIHYNNSLYYNWLFMNNIQIYGDIDHTFIPLDLYYNLNKNWCYYVDNAIFDFDIDTFDILKDFGVSPLEFIRKIIDTNYYLEIDFNHDYIDCDDSNFIKKDMFHQILIFGYDDEKKVINVLAYSEGLMYECEVSYRYLENNENGKYYTEVFRVIKYRPSSEMYKFDREYVIDVLKDYLYGRNTFRKVANLMTRGSESDGIVFGIKYYDLLLERGMDRLLSDIRIAHLLYEHKRCMKDRIEYMYNLNFLTEQEYLCLFKQAEDIEKTSFLNRNLILKNSIKSSEVCKTHIKENIVKIKEAEVNLYSNLIKSLEKGRNLADRAN